MQVGGLRLKVFAGTIAVGLLGIAALSVSSAAAYTFADACGTVTEHELAKAFDQQDAVTDTAVVREPGNSAGVLRIRCHVLAFSGRQPGSHKKELEQLAAGKASALRIETWVADEGPAAAIWRANFAAKIEGLMSRARETFTEVLPGKTVFLPTLGAEHALGFIATTGGLVKLRALWWSANAASIVSMSATVAKGSPIVSSVQAVAAPAVPLVH